MSHAVYAPSSAHRWTVCTASAEAIAKLGEQDEGEEARDGTAAHEEIERVLGGQLADGFALPVNPAHPAAQGVALVLDYVRQLPPGRLWVEQRVRLTDDIWGRCDIAHYDEAGETLTIVDYKNGFVNVEAEENEQLMIYAAASIFTHNLAVRWVRLVVVQPNSFLPVPRVKQWVTSVDALYDFASRVAAIPDQTKTFVAGEQCKYCPLFGRCPASQDVLARLTAMFAHGPDAVPSDQVAMFLAARKPIEDWFKALEKSATRAALAGRMPAGMKLVETTKHRTWKDERQVTADIFAAKGLDALSPPTPAQAEKIIDPALGAEWADRPEGGPALAFENDRRPTWKRKDVKEMFAASVAVARRETGEAA